MLKILVVLLAATQVFSVEFFTFMETYRMPMSYSGEIKDLQMIFMYPEEVKEVFNFVIKNNLINPASEQIQRVANYALAYHEFDVFIQLLDYGLPLSKWSGSKFGYFETVFVPKPREDVMLALIRHGLDICEMENLKWFPDLPLSVQNVAIEKCSISDLNYVQEKSKACLDCLGECSQYCMLFSHINL